MEIDAWSRLTKTRLSPWDVSVIRRIDAAVLAEWHKKQPKLTQETAPNQSEPISVPMTDVAGISSLMKSFRARAKEAYGKNG